MPSRALTLLGLLILAPFLGAAENPAAASPLRPAPAPASASSTPASPFRWEVLGLIGTSAAPAVRINDTTENAAAWLRVGESFGALKLISADVDAGTATIQVGNERAVLRLRVSGVTPGAAASTATGTSSNSSGSTPAAPPAPLPSTGDPAADAKRDQVIAEREARMLVNDLLEISMIQRKEYEDKQAAAAKPAPEAAP